MARGILKKNRLNMNKSRKNTDFSLESYLKDKRNVINKALAEIVFQNNLSRQLISAMDYSLMAGGKRLRPVLCFASAECINGQGNALNEPVIIPACAIEMIHTYSLIHDDLPAMDDDDFRRGKLTLHKKFSEATAVLAGDALLTHAFYILSNPVIVCNKPIKNSILVELINIISNAAGTNGMVEGQMLDMQAEAVGNSNLKPEKLLKYLKKMHGLKTGKMIQASIQAGAVTAGADKEQLSYLMDYAEKIGMAFQVIDDILDIEGDSSVLGKPVGSDELNCKLTFPRILGLKESKKYAEDLVSQALTEIKIFGEKAVALEKIAKYIIKRNH